ncbi:hypothetical protein KXQ82_06970 [Mucilaginibacter sp. HMF5004]|uniref:hypothetical protein n=1 Tax=Mucilaginibacter rivuli TaxID=2857527 RepID=UPI001C5FD0F6|nr:hypothetical protein [Mucilaginibacter rivuli]MBW4889448.1 hypothetical protein [Mucilaginibacter rivuli]
MKTKNVTKGLICAIVSACFIVNVNAAPIAAVTLKADTTKMAKKKMDDKIKVNKKMDDKMKVVKKMEKKKMMKKDSVSKM